MNKQAKGFEEALSELEDIVNHLEGDDLTLENALAYFEQGIKLMRTCDEQLRKADGKLKELLKDENGEFVEKLMGVDLRSVVDAGEADG